MKSANDYVTDIKSRNEYKSDYSIAKFLGISRQSMTFYKKGGTFDDKTAFKIAIYLDIEPLLLISEMNAQRAKNDDDKKFWNSTIKKLSSYAASVFLLFGTTPALLESIQHCILCKIANSPKEYM